MGLNADSDSATFENFVHDSNYGNMTGKGFLVHCEPVTITCYLRACLCPDWKSTSIRNTV